MSLNEIKHHMDIPKSLYYGTILSIIINVLVFFHGGAPKLAKLSRDWQFFPVVYRSTVSRKLQVLLS